MNRIRAHLLLLLMSCSLFGLSSDEQILIEAELKSPITLLLKNGQRVSGNPTSVSIEQIQLSSAEGVGEIIFTFSPDEIERIEIPGESYKSLALEALQSGDSEKALEIMDRLYAQRSALLPLMPASESNFFVLYIDLILDSPAPARSIGVGSRLRPQIQNPAALRALDDAILESYQQLELFEDALPLARKWVNERSPYGDSALGYYVLGSEYLRQTEYEKALELALQPVVFSSPLPTDKLSHCYALAVAAALELRERKHAAVLFEEMTARGFVWPESDSTLQPYLEKITEYLAEHEAD